MEIAQAGEGRELRLLMIQGFVRLRGQMELPGGCDGPLYEMRRGCCR